MIEVFVTSKKYLQFLYKYQNRCKYFWGYFKIMLTFRLLTGFFSKGSIVLEIFKLHRKVLEPSYHWRAQKRQGQH